MFGTGYPGKGAAEGENHDEGWEIGEAEMWALQRNKTDGREGPHPSVHISSQLALCCALDPRRLRVTQL